MRRPGQAQGVVKGVIVVDAVRVAYEQRQHKAAHVLREVRRYARTYTRHQLQREVQRAHPVPLRAVAGGIIGPQLSAPGRIDAGLLPVPGPRVHEFKFQLRYVAGTQLRQRPGVVRDVYAQPRQALLRQRDVHPGVVSVPVRVVAHTHGHAPGGAVKARGGAEIGGGVEPIPHQAHGGEYADNRAAHTRLTAQEHQPAQEGQAQGSGGVIEPVRREHIPRQGAARRERKSRRGQTAHARPSPAFIRQS